MAKTALKKKPVAVVAKKPVAKPTPPKPVAVVKPAAKPEAETGHNSGVSKQKLTSIVERIENLEEEKRVLSDDIKEVYTEAKNASLDIRVIRYLVVQRRKNRDQLRQFKDLLDQYAFILDPELSDVLS